MIRVMCLSNKGYKELEVGRIYYFDNFKAVNPFTKSIFGNLYNDNTKNFYLGIYPRNLFVYCCQ